nr:hypothetical protein CFP56_71101 [Quercus suber]
MALQLVNESEEDEYHSLSPHEQSQMGSSTEEAHLDDISEELQSPVHIIASMQGAFEESIVESAADDIGEEEDARDHDAEWRRQELLGHKRYDDSWKSRWRQTSAAKHHPLSKLMAQIIFGMHLLLQQQAKSNEEVVRILQTHVNEVDTFLEKTAEDFDLAIADIEERIKHLRLPMTHLDVFKVMLDDTAFRTQLIDGNAKIERIVERTARAMSAALGDTGEGVRANTDLSQYLETTATQWNASKAEITTVFTAMRGNEQGWMKYLRDLQTKGKALGKSLALLGSVINEMSKLAAAADARHRYGDGSSRHVGSSDLQSKFSRDTHVRTDSRLDKPLPVAPSVTVPTGQNLPKQRVPNSPDHFERPRQQPMTPTSFSYKLPKDYDEPVRPQTANNERKVSRTGSTTGNPELDEYLSKSGPLRSNPPDGILRSIQPSKSGSLRSNPPDRVLPATMPKSERAKGPSQAATDFLNAQTVPRPKSQVTTLLMSRGNDSSSRPSSKGMDKAMSVRSVSTTKRASSLGNSFARSLSRRMESSRPSSRDTSNASDATKLKLSTMHEATESQNSAPLDDPEQAQRPKSRGGPLNFFSRSASTALTASESAESFRRGADGSMSKSSADQYGSSSRATSIRSKATMRSIGLRNIFSRKSKIGNVSTQ